MTPRFSIDRDIAAGYARRRLTADDASAALRRRRYDLTDANQHLLVLENDRKNGLSRPQDAMLASTKQRLEEFRADLAQLDLSISEVNSGYAVILGDRIADFVKKQDGPGRYIGGDAQ